MHKISDIALVLKSLVAAGLDHHFFHLNFTLLATYSNPISLMSLHEEYRLLLIYVVYHFSDSLSRYSGKQPVVILAN